MHVAREGCVEIKLFIKKNLLCFFVFYPWKKEAVSDSPGSKVSTASHEHYKNTKIEIQIQSSFSEPAHWRVVSVCETPH